MPQIDNDKVLGCILRSIIGVISRRTTKAYAINIVDNIIKELTDKHSFLQYVEIQKKQYAKVFDVVNVQSEINHINSREIGKAGKDFIEKITYSIGKNAGYYFLREIKEDIPYDYEVILKELGIDLDMLQFEFTTRIKRSFIKQINNADVLKYTITVVFEVMDREFGRDTTCSIMFELVDRLSTEYPALKYVKINDIRSIQGIDLLKISPEINKVEQTKIGGAVQRIIQEINNYYGEQRGGFSIIDKLKNQINIDYISKLGEMGVNLDIIQLKKELVIKHVLKAVINVLSQSSTQSYAILMMNNILKKFECKFDFLKHIKIDSTIYSYGGNEISISPDIESIRPSLIGRGLQKIMEDIISSLGEDAGNNFIEKFKKRLGKAYVLRIEEMGVNLHMIELKQNLMW